MRRSGLAGALPDIPDMATSNRPDGEIVTRQGDQKTGACQSLAWRWIMSRGSDEGSVACFSGGHIEFQLSAAQGFGSSLGRPTSGVSAKHGQGLGDSKKKRPSLRKASSMRVSLLLPYSNSLSVFSELVLACASMAIPACRRIDCLAYSVLSLAMSVSMIWLLAASRLLRFTANMSWA